jgi:hypothetical protein
MTELSWVYPALGRNADALRLWAGRGYNIHEKDAVRGPILRIGSRKSRRVQAHLKKLLRGFDVCSSQQV